MVWRKRILQLILVVLPLKTKPQTAAIVARMVVFPGKINIQIMPPLRSSNCSDSSKNGGFPWKDKHPNNATFVDQATVGSLTFNVIDASCLKSSGESSRQVASVDAGAPAMKSEKARSSTRKSAPRTKVPFEKGYSQMDWLKLTQTHPDLAGLKGQSNRRLVSMSEVKQNQKEGSMWTVLKGRVYNISPYMKFHPGGTYVVFQLWKF
ncbi:hypothetical protein Gotur_013143 [Gossypium turneri]